ncbi:DUF805 domain-containing protein [Terricaulis sp.]|uniref:DUF805 domain-containing protein n=1 Tax=Terricaulis sp. TaxID=2768686 RepID=UPI0037850B74
MSWLKLYWGWTGRLNRLQFILGSYSLSFVSTLAMMALVPMLAPPAPGGFVANNAAWTVIAITQLVPLPWQLSLFTRRLHDVNLSGRWLLVLPAIVVADLGLIRVWAAFDESVWEMLLFLPMLAGMVLVFFAPGRPEPNRFGAPPRAGWLP